MTQSIIGPIVVLLLLLAIAGGIVYLVWRLISNASAYEKKSVQFSVEPNAALKNGQTITGTWRYGFRGSQGVDIKRLNSPEALANNKLECRVLDQNKKVVKKIPTTLTNETKSEGGIMHANFSFVFDLTDHPSLGSGYLQLSNGILTYGSDLPVIFG